jgi:DNA transformation protein and related proteins
VWSRDIGTILRAAATEAVFRTGRNVRRHKIAETMHKNSAPPLIRYSINIVRQPDELTTYMLELLAPLGPVSARSMFGGVGLFHGKLMFGLIARDELFFKVGDANRPEYEAAGEAPFDYETKHGRHTLHSYWRCPPELVDDIESFQAWARRAVEAAVAAARGKPKISGKRGTAA